MPVSALQDCFQGALLGTMLGDAVGAPWEGVDAERIDAFLTAYPDLPPAEQQMNRALFGLLLSDLVTDARYTDDTQMTLALAETLLEYGDAAQAPKDTRFEAALAARFVQKFQSFRGYGPGAYSVLMEIRSGTPWQVPARQLFGGMGSFGNGAAMRVAPIGLFFHDAPPAVLRQAARRSALPTHTHPLGIGGVVLQAAAVAAACRLPINDFDANTFLADVESRLGDDEGTAPYRAGCASIRQLLPHHPAPEVVGDVLGNDIAAPASVPAALYAFLSHPDNFQAAITFAVRIGGDTDTIAAMCGAISGTYLGASALPTSWLAAVENGIDGRDDIRDLGDRLFTVWQARAAA